MTSLPTSVVRTAALVVPAGTCALFASFRGEVTQATAVLVLVLWVVAGAATGDRIAGVLAALSGGLWFDFFLTQPYQTFTISDGSDLAVTLLLVVIGVAVTEIALWGRREQARAARRSGYLDGVLGTAEAVSEGTTTGTVLIEVVEHQIRDVLAVDEVHFVVGSTLDPRVAVLDHDGVVRRGGSEVDVGRTGLPTDERTAVVVRRGSRVLGHFFITSATEVTYPTREQRRVAVLLADQVAAALDTAT